MAAISHRRIWSSLCLIFAVLFTATVANIATSHSTSAVSAGDWQAGRIIDDGVFYSPYDLTTQQVQQFLNAKVPTCDTNGTQPYAGTTAGQYGAARGNPPPYTCLKDYRQNTTAKSAESGLCNGYPAVNQSAAEIITGVASSCGINPKVLLVLLQKEQGLVTDDWPWQTQYRSATGYGCPDSAACDAQYYGFFNQVYGAARGFKYYAKYADSFNHIAYRNNQIRYSPDTNCGSSSVYIHNQATAGLYNYTPYQPNQSALNNMYGMGDACGSYGNRNFWRTYNDWFGSTTLFNSTVTMSQGLTITPSGPTYMGQTITASYKVRNTASYDVYAGGLGICARVNGQYFDFGFSDQNLIPAGGEITISYNKVLSQPGAVHIFTCSYHASIGGWANAFYPYNTGAVPARTADLTVQDNPLLTTSVSLSPSNPSIGQTVTATVNVRNNSPSAVGIGGFVIAGRDPNGQNVDFPGEANVTIPGNSTYTYSKTRTFTTPGNHSFFIANLQGGTWNTTYPKAASGVARAVNVNVLDNPLITSGVTFSPASPAMGQPVTASMSIRNTSNADVSLGTLVFAVRDPWGSNLDFPVDSNVVVPANSTITYSKTRTFPSPGAHQFFVASFKNGIWSSAYPKSLDGSVVRQGTLQLKWNPLITAGISFSPTNPTTGQSVTASITIKNASASSVDIGTMVIAGRDPHGNNVDFPVDVNTTIPADTTITYSKSRTFSAAGNYTFFLSNFRNNIWDRNYPQSADGSVIRQRNLTIN